MATSRSPLPARLAAAALSAAVVLLAAPGAAPAAPAAPRAVIGSGPSGTVASATASFDVGAVPVSAKLTCALDAGRPRPCPNPAVFTGLDDGPHHFVLEATARGVSNRAQRAWVVDTRPPSTAILAAPSGVTGSSGAAFAFAASEAGALFECSLDGAPFSACESGVAVGGLAPGAHGFRVRAIDAAGNVEPAPPQARWTVASPPPSPAGGPAATPGPNRAPVAAFTFSPGAPVTGRTVTLRSASVDADGPLASLRWDLDADGVFGDRTGPVVQTSFRTAGPHTVALRAIDAAGASATAFQTVTVRSGRPGPPQLMRPFPIVRIIGSFNVRRTRISLLTVRAPRGASVRGVCRRRDRGCPATAVRLRVGGPRRRTQATLALAPLQRTLRPGAVLEMRVTMARRIGKFTRIVIRRGRPPLRTDRCLLPGRSRPVSCPS